MRNVLLTFASESVFSIHQIKNSFDPNFKQVKLDMAYLTMSRVWSVMSHCKRSKVGALLVKDNSIISDGFNGTPKGVDNCCEDSEGNTHWYTLHAESNVITKLSRNAVSGEDSTMYVTMSPCKECSKLILQSGIKRVVFLTAYRNIEGLEFLANNGIEVSYYIDINPLIEFNASKITASETNQSIIELIKKQQESYEKR